MEVFRSYQNAVTTRVSEGCAGIFAKSFIVLGIMLILAQLNKLTI
jgi:hypothetical protein